MNDRNRHKTVQIWLAWVLSLGLGACATMEPTLPDERTLGNLVVKGVPEIPPALVARMQQYRNTRSARLLGWLP